MYYVSMADVRGDPGVTLHAGAKWAVAVLAVGILGVLLMLPGRSHRTVLVDDEGRFFIDPASPQVVAHDAAGGGAGAAGTVAVPSAAPAPAPPARFGRGRRWSSRCSACWPRAGPGGGGGYFASRAGEARSPSEVVDLFGQARVTCLDLDVITISTSTKTLGCRTDDAQIITVTTYGTAPRPTSGWPTGARSRRVRRPGCGAATTWWVRTSSSTCISSVTPSSSR